MTKIDEEKKKAEELLKKFEFEPVKFGYELGCMSKLLNIHAQQRRAFNLVWALDMEGRVKGTNVAVVGAGIAGLTVATGLAAIGAHVTVYERMADILHMQDGNLVRFVHPNVATWPEVGAGYPVTRLPFMNWCARTAGEVSAELRRQWDVFEETFKGKSRVIRASIIERISGREDGGKVDIIDSKLGKQEYSAVVLAVGYGIERSDMSKTASYWRNDDLAQPVMEAGRKRRYLVSGTGDGGLVDVLRLKIRAFQHKEFFEKIMFQDWLLNAAERVTQAGWNNLWGPEEEIRRTFKSFFDQRRLDTEVVLNSRREWFASPAQMLHKLCVSLLIAVGEVTYVQGELLEVKEDPTQPGGLLAGIDGRPEPEKVDVVVQRQGTESELQKLFFPDDKDSYERLKDKWQQSEEEDPKTHVEHYPLGYLADEFRRAHYEKGYEVGFALIHQREAFQVAEAIQTKLMKSDNTFRKLDLAKLLEEPVVFEWNGRRAALKIEQAQLLHFSGQDKFAHGMSWRQHLPETRWCLILGTDSKCLLDNLLDDRCLPYHLFRFYLDDNFPKDAAVDNFVNTDAHVYLVRREYCLEIHCLPGMHQAHELLRVPTLIEVMGNTWSVRRLGGIGWAVQNRYEINRTHQRGNELVRVS